MSEICTKNYNVLSLQEWALGDGVNIAATGMKHWSQSSWPTYGLHYISLFYRTKSVPSSVTWSRLEDYLSHLAEFDDDDRPHIVMLRNCGNVESDPTLSHLKLLGYRSSKCTDEELKEKWGKYAYETKLQSPHGDNYWRIKEKYYPSPKRSWDSDLPRKHLLDRLKN